MSKIRTCLVFAIFGGISVFAGLGYTHASNRGQRPHALRTQSDPQVT